jgi:hypothetical protein
MKQRIESLDEYIAENKIYEANITKTLDIKEFEKQLPLVFNVYDYLKVWYRKMGPYSNSISFERQFLNFTKDFNFMNVAISKGAYTKYMIDQYNQGYGGSAKPKYWHEIWDEKVEGEIDDLMETTQRVLGNDKFFAKVAKEIESKLGKLEAAKKVLLMAWHGANDSYDRDLTMDKYYNRANEIWANASDVHLAVGRGSLGRVSQESDLRDYLRSLSKTNIF